MKDYTMKKIITLAAMGLAVISLAACGGKDDAGAKTDKSKGKIEATVSGNKSTTKGYSKADFMKACEVSLTAAQCGCYVDFYKSIGISVSDLGNQEKITAAMTGLKPEQAMKVAKCVQ